MRSLLLTLTTLLMDKFNIVDFKAYCVANADMHIQPQFNKSISTWSQIYPLKYSFSI